jgi:holo-[acyl-carrier protein] synthase
MIRGIGTDIIGVSRIRRLMDKHGSHFLEKIFTEPELLQMKSRAGKAHFLAGRWAAKEAVSKALGCGIGASCAWKDIEILNGELGGPSVSLSGAAAKTASRIGASNAHVSISHEKNHAVAFAILEG